MELEFTVRPVAVKAHLSSYHRRQVEDIKCGQIFKDDA